VFAAVSRCVPPIVSDKNFLGIPGLPVRGSEQPETAPVDIQEVHSAIKPDSTMPTSTIPMETGISEEIRTEIADGLANLLADSYLLYLKTHNFHWNVTGPMFQTLHLMFEGQYNELALAVDMVAERIRALGDYSPGGLAALAEIARMNELGERASAEKMAASLIENHTKLIKDAAKAREVAADAEDKETEDLMITRIQVHEKTVWMLKSFLK